MPHDFRNSPWMGEPFPLWISQRLPIRWVGGPIAALTEERKHPRISLRSEVWLGQDGIFTRTHELLRDLSEGGAFVETSQQFAIGSILNIQFTLPEVRRPISTTVAVRHLRVGVGFGVQFLDLSPEDRRVVSAFLSRHSGH